MTSLDSEIPGLWAAYKTAMSERELRDQLILHYSPLVKYVAGRMAVGLPQNVEQADLVSYGHLRPHRCDREVRPRARLQVRDVRHLTGEGRHPRRAPRHRLGAPFGPGEGPEDRAGVRQARGARCTARRPTPSWPTSSASMTSNCRRRSARSPSSASSPSTRCCRRVTAADSTSLGDMVADDRRRPGSGVRAAGDAPPAGRGDRTACPTGRRRS